MNYELLLALLLTIAPITELRAGLPIIINYCLKNNLSILPFFLLIISLNIAVIFILFFFFDFLHKHFLKISFYERFFNKIIHRMRKKQEKFERRFYQAGYFALAIFVGIPLPGTGVWTGTFLAWLLGLERKKSIFAISVGVFIAGLIILLASYGIISLFYFTKVL